LRKEVLLRSAAAMLQPPLRLRRVDVYPDVPMGSVQTAALHVHGRGATLEACMASMGAGAGVLTLAGHSGGIDAPLPSNGLLCTMDRMGEGWDATRAPTCAMSGICVMRQAPIGEVWASGAPVPPERVRARVFLFNACWGLRSPVGLIEWRWSLCQRLLQGAQVGAIVTSWSIIRTGPAGVHALITAIASGQTLGEAVAAHNNGVPGWERALLCILGDPRMRLPAPAAALDYPAMPTRQPPPPPLFSATANATFLRACLAAATPAGPAPAATVPLVEALQRYEVAAYGHTRGESLRAELRTAVRDHFLAAPVSLFQLWSDMSHACERADDDPRCAGCGRLTQTHLHSLRIPSAPRRRVSVCPSCGHVEDAPEHSTLALDVGEPGTIRLAGGLPEGDTLGVAIIEQSLGAQRHTWPWPLGGDGRPRGALRTDRPWPVGPFRLTVVFVAADLGVVVLGRLMRCDAVAAVAPRGPSLPIERRAAQDL
jgi:hypothetical protein